MSRASGQGMIRCGSSGSGQTGHIDPQLFRLFVRGKVYRRYAETFLDPEQIDEVDESAIPGCLPPALKF